MKVILSQRVLEREDQVWHQLVKGLDHKVGCLFASDYTYPGRYHPWQVGLEDPILQLKGWGRYFEIEVLDASYENVLSEIYIHLSQETYFEKLSTGRSTSNHNAILVGSVKQPSDSERVAERERFNEGNIFTLIKRLLSLFETECPMFGFYGSFGYKLVHQFETLDKGVHGRDDSLDLLLYLPRRLIVKANAYERTKTIDYTFLDMENFKTDIFKEPIQRRRPSRPTGGIKKIQSTSHYETLVRDLKPFFERGELFEAVPSYERLHSTNTKASQLFNHLRIMNPSPFHYLINMGDEQLLGASPEMFLRVNNRVVETCPISGTIPRGEDSISDHHQIMKLLNSQKDEDELTMCTDVDRNDKSKVCDPSTIKVLGRRQIELYSHLIHTVDHVTGNLRSDQDGIDAFIAHMWAVTVTGAPKKAAMNWIEANEASSRQWYGGAVGYFTANGDVNTGLTLRGIHLKEGLASVRVGATILYDSDPEMEFQETLTKAAAMEKVLAQTAHKFERPPELVLPETRVIDVLVIDHDDSFVHTLAGYFEKYGCRVKTIRQSRIEKYFSCLDSLSMPDLIILSPGPGTPNDFKLHDSIQWAMDRNIPIFGVCLGLQGIITYFGGTLGQLELPMHGKSSQLMARNENRGYKIEKQLFELDAHGKPINIGRYHSLYALEIPDTLHCYAMTEDQCPMAIFHKELPIWAVQFHPESIMSAEDNFGGKIIENLIQKIKELTL